MSAACTHCDDTGSLSKELWGSLDCAHCGVAEERTVFDLWLTRELPNVGWVDGWIVYQRGKAAALEQAGKKYVETQPGSPYFDGSEAFEAFQAAGGYRDYNPPAAEVVACGPNIALSFLDGALDRLHPGDKLQKVVAGQ